MSATAIASVEAWEVLDSRGNPTVACEVRLAGGARGSATVPSGASTGKYEAHELRDGGERYGGLGVSRAVMNVRGEIAHAVAGLDAADQAALDHALRELDGTPDLSRLGGNAVLAVSVAAALAAAEAERAPLYARLGGPPLLPLPQVNVISGGAHARGGVAFQDFLAIPVGAESFAEALDQAWRVRRATAAVAEERGWTTLVADEGGLGPPLPSNRAALELLAAGIERARVDVAIGIDVAANQLAAPPDLDELERWCAEFPIVSIEDPRGEDDWEGWAEVTRRLAPRVQLVGDDLFATSAARLVRGIDAGTATAILIKPNQAGTLTDTHEALSTAHEAGYATIVSARSGDTEDSWLADLAVGWAAGQIKVGSTARSERTAKWNRLLRIEAELGPVARFAGYSAARS